MDYTIGSIAPIVLFPLAAFVINAFIVKRFTKLAVGISCASILASFIFALRIFCDFLNVYSENNHVHKVFNWFDISGAGLDFVVKMGVYIDNMGAVMLLMVTGAASLIHIFSTYYMKDDARFGRFFVYLSLFTSAMLGLVLSDNLLSVFIFWEIMGFCSYSLIGFYYEKEGAGNASIKAFMTTRVGDVFFLLGILALWTQIGSVSFVDIYAAIAENRLSGVFVLGIPIATFAGLSIFMGTIGKSAQVPLQVWLPDAMWGPTPCSALIHAATMVAAGVYLSLRMYPLMELGGLTIFIAYIGAITAFLAATIALIQTDIKAVLAYSTISQLGYMVLGIGVGSYNAAFMHLITHAVFKACLFLSAGSIIHSLHDHHTHGHVQEMPRMGGLRHKMPFTFWCMMLCTLAISGVPFFSGFVSKDRILGDALVAASHAPQLWPVAVLGFSAAFLTAFYMFRMMFLTFFGEPRDKDLYEHTHKEKLLWNRNVPLMILALFTLGLFFSGSMTGQGFLKIFPKNKYEWFQTLITKPSIGEHGNIRNFMTYQRQNFSFSDEKSTIKFPMAHYDPDHGLDEHTSHHIHQLHMIGAILSILIAFSGILLAALMYLKKSINPATFVGTFSAWYKALKNKYYFDSFYIEVLIKKVLLRLNNFLAWIDLGVYDRYIVDGQEVVNRCAYKISNWIDQNIVDMSVDGTGASVRVFNVILRTLQSGKVQFYFVVFIVVLTSYILNLNI